MILAVPLGTAVTERAYPVYVELVAFNSTARKLDTNDIPLHTACKHGYLEMVSIRHLLVLAQVVVHYQ